MPLVLPASVLAADINYSAGLTLAHYTNINHVPDPAESEFSQSAHGTVSLVENTADLVANLDAGVEFTDYTNDIATDQNLARFVGNGLWYLVPGQLEWFMSDTYTQTSINILGSDTPENRQNANAFSTGPNYIMHFSNRNSLVLEARVEDYYFEEVETDNQRLSGAARWGYAINSALELSLDYESETVNYNNDVLNSDYVRNDVFVGFQYQRDVNTLEAHAGYARVSSDHAADIEENRYFIALQNQRTRTSNIRLEHERVLSDTSTDLQDIVSANDPAASPLATTSELYISTSTNLIYTNLLSSGSFLLNFERSYSDYLTADTLDQSRKGVLMNIVWNVGGRSSFILDAHYSENTFVNLVPERVDEDSVYAITYRRNAGRNINLSLRAEASERQSTQLSENYDSFVTMMTLEYTSL